MNDDQLNDLKQFITVTVSQATATMATKENLTGLATKADLTGFATKDDLQRLDIKLSKKLDDLDLKVDTVADTLNEHLNDHETRLTKLEH